MTYFKDLDSNELKHQSYCFLSPNLKDNTTKSFFAYTNSLKSNIWHIISIYDDEFYLSKLSIVIFWIILFVEAEE